jgi:hypothetical protein
VLEGLCSCVSEDANRLIGEETTEQCDRDNVHFESQKYLNMSLSRYERRSLQEMKWQTCHCSVSSSYTIIWWNKQ